MIRLSECSVVFDPDDANSAGTFTRTTVSWSWPVRARRMWTPGRPPSSEPEFILNVSRYDAQYWLLPNPLH